MPKTYFWLLVASDLYWQVASDQRPLVLRLQHDVQNVLSMLMVGQYRSLVTNDQKYVLGITPLATLLP